MAIQLGLVGVAVLLAMWIAHLLLFRGNGLAEWIGLVVVPKKSLWLAFQIRICSILCRVYVIGVGVAGGIVKKAGPKKEFRTDLQ